jgi:HTH-type transcriptional regulator/antitoxin HigA
LKVVEHLIDFLNRDEAVSLADDVSQYLAVLSDLVSKFERERFPSERATGNEILGQLMEAHNLKQTDLGEELGGQSVVSLILRGERELNVRQIRALADRFKVSPEVFL